MKQRPLLIIIALLIICTALYAQETSTTLSGITAPKEIFAEGMDYYTAGNYTAAAKTWDRLVELDPDNKNVMHYLELTYTLIHKKHILIGQGIEQYNDNDLIDAYSTFNHIVSEYGNDRRSEEWMERIQVSLNEQARQRKINQLIVEGDALIQKEKWAPAQAAFHQIITLEPQHSYARQRLSYIDRQIRQAQIAAHVQTLLAEAQTAFNNKNYRLALDKCNTVLTLAPDNEKAITLINRIVSLQEELNRQEQIKQLLKQGITYFDNAEYVVANSYFEQVLGLDENNATARKYIKQIKLLWDKQHELTMQLEQARKFLEQGVFFHNNEKFKDAISKFENAVTLVEENEDTASLQIKNEAQAWLEKTHAAIADYKKRRREEMEERIQEYLSKGISYFYNEEYEQCILWLSKVLDIDEDNEFAHDYIKRSKDILRNISEEKIGPDSPYYALVENLKDKGYELYNQGRYSESLEYFEKIILLFPANREARTIITKIGVRLDPEIKEAVLEQHYRAGIAAQERKDMRRAENEFKTITEIDKTYRDAQARLASILRKKEAKKPTVNFISRKQLETWHTLAIDLYNKKQFTQAESTAKKILTDNTPDNPYRVKAINLIQKSRMATGATSTAASTTKTTQQQDPEAQRLYLQSVTYYVNGNYEKAYDYCQRVLKRDPQHVKAQEMKAKLKRKLGY